MCALIEERSVAEAAASVIFHLFNLDEIGGKILLFFDERLTAGGGSSVGNCRVHNININILCEEDG